MNQRDPGDGNQFMNAPIAACCYVCFADTIPPDSSEVSVLQVSLSSLVLTDLSVLIDVLILIDALILIG